MRVTFTDDADNEETLTSAATVAVAAAANRRPLTAAFQDLPDSHDGSTAFTFRVLFSEDVRTSYGTCATMLSAYSEGDVTGARRVDGRNDLWEIHRRHPDDASEQLASPSRPTGPFTDDAEQSAPGKTARRQLTNSTTATVTGPAEAPPTETSATGAPTISGTPQVEQTLTADTSSHHTTRTG